MNKYRCLIVDDEPIAQRILLRYLGEQPRVEVCGQCYDAAEARAFAQAHPVDLLLLDIEMPGETGIALLKSLRNRPVAIFTTAHLDFALEGFELGVLDYLVKPIRPERFDLAIRRAVEFLDLQQYKAALGMPGPVADTLVIQSGIKRIALDRGGITHVQGLKDYVIIHTAARRYVVRATMKNLENSLGSAGFVRVHKSFIVARDKLAFLNRQKIEFGDFQIPVGRRYRARMLHLSG